MNKHLTQIGTITADGANPGANRNPGERCNHDGHVFKREDGDPAAIQ